MSFALRRVFPQVLRSFCCKVPNSPVPGIDTSRLPKETKIGKELIEHLESISLVDFGNEKGVRIVEEAIRFADQLTVVDTEGVQPLTSVLEDRSLPLRADVVTEGNCRPDILGNAKKTDEGYFVAPPGNIPLKPKVENPLKEANN
ncbi:glutamyl-tRNA(Gln) amidotransferase subunit C, mitochondrial [Cimex lectularius]|uniref:Glutamyl-tRNA(Gln) amidotransferase subunit C, mitochondrial n=1 Tax=Cimex lectularius TaxID=79782 RepID=A0A8I6S2Q0_CIMLE|nr:glutamyl-tRNA(Gln) amidotransferase subunit C, mitochondrial [Cimex lectularius]